MGQEAQGDFWGPPWVTGGGWGISGDGGTGQHLGSAELGALRLQPNPSLPGGGSPSARISSGPHLHMEAVGKFTSAKTERPRNPVRHPLVGPRGWAQTSGHLSHTVDHAHCPPRPLSSEVGRGEEAS